MSKNSLPDRTRPEWVTELFARTPEYPSTRTMLTPSTISLLQDIVELEVIDQLMTDDEDRQKLQELREQLSCIGVLRRNRKLGEAIADA